MPKDTNIAAQERFAEGVNTGNLDVFDEVVAPGVMDHDPAPEQGPGPQGFKDMFRTMRDAFPDLQVTPEHMTATEDDVALAYTITGTHQGDFLGVAPTGRKVTARGVQIGRFENGRLAERWGSSDQLAILQQLGAEPQPGGEAREKKLTDKIRDTLTGQ